MAIWLDNDANLPDELAQLLAGKRFRRDIGMIAATGRRELVAETLGEHVFDYFLRNKKAEYEEYLGQVTQFELDRYLPHL